jgi:hypothetical protein
MLIREIIAVHCENHMKNMLYVKAGGKFYKLVAARLVRTKRQSNADCRNGCRGVSEMHESTIDSIPFH